MSILRLGVDFLGVIFFYRVSFGIRSLCCCNVEDLSFEDICFCHFMGSSEGLFLSDCQCRDRLIETGHFIRYCDAADGHISIVQYANGVADLFAKCIAACLLICFLVYKKTGFCFHSRLVFGSGIYRYVRFLRIRTLAFGSCFVVYLTL